MQDQIQQMEKMFADTQKKLHSKRVGTLLLSAGMCSVLHKEQVSPAPLPSNYRTVSLHWEVSHHTYKKGAVQWTMVDALQFVPSKDTCFAYKYQPHVDVHRDFCPQNSIHAHQCTFSKQKHVYNGGDASALSGILDRNAIEYSGTVMSKAADMAQAVNNLRLKIMKAPRLTVSTEYCKTQELFRAITVVQDCNQRNCSIHRQIYTSLMKPTQQGLCVLYSSKKPLF